MNKHVRITASVCLYVYRAVLSFFHSGMFPSGWSRSRTMLWSFTPSLLLLPFHCRSTHPQ